MITKEQEAEILRLHHVEKWLVGTIAGQLRVHHTTVQRVLRRHGVMPEVVHPRPSIAGDDRGSAGEVPEAAGVAAVRDGQGARLPGQPGALP